jgi:hypothetical protein
MLDKKKVFKEDRSSMPDRINPKIDLAFNRIFGVEQNKDLTISLLNSIVSKEDQIEDFIIRTGAPLLMPLETDEGKKVQKRFEQYLEDVRSKQLTSRVNI